MEFSSSGIERLEGQTFSHILHKLQLFGLKESLKKLMLLKLPYISPRGQMFLQKKRKSIKHKKKNKKKIKLFK